MYCTEMDCTWQYWAVLGCNWAVLGCNWAVQLVKVFQVFQVIYVVWLVAMIRMVGWFTVIQVLQVVRMISLDGMHSENIWFSWINHQIIKKSHACDGRTDERTNEEKVEYSAVF